MEIPVEFARTSSRSVTKVRYVPESTSQMCTSILNFHSIVTSFLQTQFIGTELLFTVANRE